MAMGCTPPKVPTQAARQRRYLVRRRRHLSWDATDLDHPCPPLQKRRKNRSL
jgi:transposase